MGSPVVEMVGLPDCRSRCDGTHQPGSKATTDCTRKARPSIETLPDVELGCIFNYLTWRDKLSLLKAIPQVWRVINSPLGWQKFHAGEKRSAEGQQEELACVHEYGHLFQHCTLWLGRPCRNTWECTCLFDNLHTHNIFPVLEALVDTCCVLRSLRLYHPSHVTPQSCDTDIFKQYQQAIERLLMYALQRNRFSLELCCLLYSQDHIRPISLRFLDYYISNPQALQLVRVLDITRITDSRLQSPAPLTCLKSMKQLSTLKIPIHCVTMGTVQSMVQNQLKNLYLLSDDCTVDHDFHEKKHLSWDGLLPPSNGSGFSVHYIFKQRVLNGEDLSPNPHVKSVCFDSLCKPISEDLLMAVAECYCTSLQLFGITHSIWKPELRLSDLSKFAAKCRSMTHFLSTVALAGSLLVSLVHNAPLLKQVQIVATQDAELHELAEIIPIMSKCLKKDWRPHSSPNTFQEEICELSFLMDEYLLRGYGL
ncbi:uncharacterized protein [Littorina saxatilis]|uniref:uncharacterized protein n=1 Tax=Littorina saxatilis TaxID=31220 RepID=UPI0038B54A7E